MAGKISQPENFPKRFMFLGASGRVGQFMRRVWSVEPEVNLHVDWQFRTAQPVGVDTFIWPDLAELDSFLAHVNSVGGLDGMYVFLGASQAGDKTCTAQMAPNVSLVEQALRAAVAAKIPRVLVASSSAVYGGGHGRPFREDDALEPVNAYGKAKKDMETLCRRYAAEYGIEICLLRIGNVAGADALLGTAAKWRIGDPPRTLDVFPDGDGPRRSYIGPCTLARVLKSLALRPAPLPQLVNVATPTRVSMNALLDAAGIAWIPRAVPASPLQDIGLDCSRLERLSDIDASDGAPATLVAQWRSALEAL